MGVISTEVSKAAIREELRDIKSILTDNVKLTRLKPPEGGLALWQFDVYAPTDYLDEERDYNPKHTEHITFWALIKEGFPKTKPIFYYKPNFRLASINVFRDGIQCIDEWVYDEYHAGNNTTLLMTVIKVIRDIIHDPSVSNFSSIANTDVCDWQRNMIRNKQFPTCNIKTLLDLEKIDSAASNNPPSLPTRKAETGTPSLPVANSNTAPPALPQ